MLSWLLRKTEMYGGWGLGMETMTIWSHFEDFVIINLPRDNPLPALWMNGF